jgi:chaperonin GroES
MTIKPLGNRIVVKLVKKAQTSASGIILSAEEKTEQAIGEIVSVGVGMGEEENVSKLGLNPGMKVLFGKYAGEELKDLENDQEVYKILPGKDVMAVIE